MADIMIPSIGDVPVFEKICLESSDWRNGIVVRTPNWLGDAVMAIPAIYQLKKIVPEFCGLFVVTPAPLAALFEALPFVDQVIPLKNAHAFMDREERCRVRSLAAGVCVLFNNSFRDALSLKMCKIPKLYGANARFRKVFLHHFCSSVYNIPARKASAFSFAPIASTMV